MRIDNVVVAEPSLNGVTVTDEPIWASNTGRNIKGVMTGDIVDFKTTIEVKWDLLHYDELFKIKNAIIRAMKRNNAGFFTIVYPDTDAHGNLIESSKVVYADHVPRTFYSTNPKAQYFTDVTVTFIEK